MFHLPIDGEVEPLMNLNIPLWCVYGFASAPTIICCKLLKNPENLDPTKKEPQRLERALRLNEPLAVVYFMKEDLRQIWQQADKATARRVMQDWIRRAEASGIKMLQKFAATLALYRAGILAYYDYPISTGPLEGTNNKIKTMKRQAYGFRDMEFFKLKILALHRTKYALVG